MYFTGFADEAAHDIEGQIRATKELGWENIESRGISGTNLHDINDEDFDRVCGLLQDAGIRINCFGSAIANWSKQITDPFEETVETVKRTIPRMQKLGTTLIRIMSYAVLPDRGPDDQMAEERFRRLREMHRIFTDAGITPVHENCMNYGGMGWQYTVKLLENVPGLKLVFDTGNPVFSYDRIKPEPWPMQSAWEFYTHVRDHIEYVHIKDGYWVEGTGTVFTYPGEGDGDVKPIVQDLISRGYDGGISIEPHLAVVHHEESKKTDTQVMYDNYVEYGRRMMRMVEEIRQVPA